MTIQEKIRTDLKLAMLNSDTDKKSVLRVIIGEFNRIGKEVNDTQATGIIKKMVENAVDQKNEKEEQILVSYLPKQLTEDELSIQIKNIITVKGYSSAKEMGKIMTDLKTAFGGQYDGKIASELIKKSFVTV